MIRVSAAALREIVRGTKPSWKAVIHFQTPETYSEADYLISVGEIQTSISGDRRYEISNALVTLKNEGYYFSRRPRHETPDHKLTEIYMTVLDEDILIFRGIVPLGGWTLTEMTLTLQVTA